MSEIYIVAERSDGSLYHCAFQTEFRNGSEFVRRQGTDGDIETELRRNDRAWKRLGEPTLVRWRRLTAEEHEKFNQHRHYRDALELQVDVITHNMPKARELHKQLLRHQRGEKLILLDGAYNGAAAAGDTAKMASVEALRQQLRDLTSDPRIGAAQTIDELAGVNFEPDAEAAYEKLRADLRRNG